MCEFKNNTKHSRIDSCMQNLIALLKAFDIPVLACCCGHNKYVMSIVLKDDEGDIFELMSDVSIPRKRRFYKKDSEGYYYIPEVLDDY